MVAKFSSEVRENTASLILLKLVFFFFINHILCKHWAFSQSNFYKHIFIRTERNNYTWMTKSREGYCLCALFCLLLKCWFHLDAETISHGSNWLELGLEVVTISGAECVKMVKLVIASMSIGFICRMNKDIRIFLPHYSQCKNFHWLSSMTDFWKHFHLIFGAA